MNEINELSPINPEKCNALVVCRKTNENKQCNYKKKDDGEFCGVHQKSKKVTKYSLFLNKQKLPNVNQKFTPIKKLKILDSFQDSGLPTLTQIKKWRVIDLREHIKNRGINIDLGLNKPLLCQKLGEHYGILEKYIPNIQKIVNIQSVIRGFLIRHRNKCVNKTDIYTLDSIFDIPSKYYFQFKDNDGYEYGFDIRSLKKHFEYITTINSNDANNKIKKNPYNWKPLSSNVLDDYRDRIDNILKSSDGIEDVEDVDYKLSDEKKMEQYMIEIFHKFDMLDNYTDHEWFKDLSMFQLKKLYKECEDIWNYRAALTIHAKSVLVNGGDAFHRYPVHRILKMVDTHKNKLNLQKIILKEFNRFVTEGQTVNDRKTGAKLMLTGLCTVSDKAAAAYPYLVWSMAVPSN